MTCLGELEKTLQKLITTFPQQRRAGMQQEFGRTSVTYYEVDEVNDWKLKFNEFERKFVEFKQTHIIMSKKEIETKRTKITQQDRETLLKAMAEQLGFVVIKTLEENEPCKIVIVYNKRQMPNTSLTFLQMDIEQKIAGFTPKLNVELLGL